jgi:hypothetical protein
MVPTIIKLSDITGLSVLVLVLPVCYLLLRAKPLIQEWIWREQLQEELPETHGINCTDTE